MTLRFQRGDRVQLPKRLGGGEGIVAHSFRSIRRDESIERDLVARFVDGKQRTTVVAEDELLRLPS